MGIRVLLCCFLLQNTDYKKNGRTPQKNQASAVSAYQCSAQRMPVVILL